MLTSVVALRDRALAQVQVLQDRLARTTRRERLLLGGLLVAAALYAPVAAFEWRNSQADRYVNALTDRSSARLALSASRRITSSAPDQAAVDDMKTWGMDAANIAVAQVQLEQMLAATADEAGLTGVRIDLDAETKATGPVEWLGGEIQADLRWTPIFAFLDGLTAWPEGFRITRFNYQTGASMAPLAPGMIAPPSLGGRVVIGVSVPVRLQVLEPVG